jgi:hypothetical protein
MVTFLVEPSAVVNCAEVTGVVAIEVLAIPTAPAGKSAFTVRVFVAFIAIATDILLEVAYARPPTEAPGTAELKSVEPSYR